MISARINCSVVFLEPTEITGCFDPQAHSANAAPAINTREAYLVFIELLHCISDDLIYLVPPRAESKAATCALRQLMARCKGVSPLRSRAFKLAP